MEMDFESAESKSVLLKSIERSKLFSILTIVSVVLSFVQLVFGLFKSASASLSIIPFLIQSIISLILAYNLYKFSKFTSQFSQTKDRSFFTVGLGHLKNYLIVFGIIFILLFSLILLSIIVSLITFIAS